MMLSIKNGSFSYPKGKRIILNNVNFSAEPGHLIAVLGPNGAGKTTLLRCMMGMLKWNSGASLIDETDIKNISRRELFSHIAYVPQAKNLIGASTVRNMVLLGRSSKYGIFGKPEKSDYEITDRIIDNMGLTEYTDINCNKLSGGELQMVLIARAIVGEPDIIILDEPESNLDFKNQLIVLKTLRKLADQGICVIFNTHYPAHALRYADVALLLDKNGRMITGPVSSVITEENMKAAFGVETAIGIIKTKYRDYPDVMAIDFEINEGIER